MKTKSSSAFVSSFFWVNLTQFFDTFNNNFFRTAVSTFILFEMTALPQNTRAALSGLAVGLLMLPAFLISALAGELADKYAKDRVMQVIALVQLVFILLGSMGFKFSLLWVLFVSLLGLGAGGSMLSPVKYSILPEILPTNKLLFANGIMQASVYVAILGGTVLGGIIFSLSPVWLYMVLLSFGGATALSSLLITAPTSANPQNTIDKNFIRSTCRNIRFAFLNKNILICILAISWFWGIGTMLLSELPALVLYLAGNNTLFTFFLILFSCGIGIGSMLSQILLKGKISTKLCTGSLLLATLCLADITYLLIHLSGVSFPTLTDLLHSWTGVHISLALLFFALFGGVYIVPLTTLLQTLAPIDKRARIIAANNIINAMFMVLGSLCCSALLGIFHSVLASLIFSVILNSVAVIAMMGILNKRKILL